MEAATKVAFCAGPLVSRQWPSAPRPARLPYAAGGRDRKEAWTPGCRKARRQFRRGLRDVSRAEDLQHG
eukprot:14575274-Alexandrium_andersonii.AAC.1